MKNVMKKAHEITKNIIRKGDSYRATFKLALSLAHSLVKKGVNKTIEYTTSRGSKVSVEMGEGRTVKNLILNGMELIKNNTWKTNCFLTEDYIYVNDTRAYKKLGLNRPAQIILNEELKEIYNKSMEKEKVEFNKSLEKSERLARMKVEAESGYTLKKYMKDQSNVNAI